MNEWSEYRLKDVAKNIGSGTTPSSKTDRYYNSDDYYWINTGDFNNTEIYTCKQMISQSAIDEYSGLHFYPIDTVLIAMYGASIGKVGILKVKATVNQACCAIIPKWNMVNPYFLFYLLINNKEELLKRSFGGTQPNVSQGIISNLVLSFPHLPVQQRIVSYLDDKTAKIDRAASLLQKKRDAYTRLKSSIINRAVTRGLNPNVKIKDSGVDWIGMIPENWEVKRIKEIGNLQLGKMLTEKPKEGYKLFPYLKSKNIGYLELNLNSVEEMYFSESEYKQLQLHKNDLVFSEGGEVGKTAIWNDEVKDCCIQNSVQKLTVNDKCDARYYLYLSYMLGKMGYYKSIVNLVSIMHLTYEKLRRVQVLVPPKEEQIAIADYLDTHCSRIDHAISIVDKQIDAYTRLKKSLINEVVTGKRKV